MYVFSLSIGAVNVHYSTHTDLWNSSVVCFVALLLFVICVAVPQSTLPIDPMSRFNLKRGTPQEEFPYLRDNHTLMGQILTLHLYTRQFNRATESGVIFDDIIRPGLEEPGEMAIQIFGVIDRLID